MVKLLFFTLSFLMLLCLSVNGEVNEGKETSDLVLTIRFLNDPPYQTSWWPWSDDHFVIEASICNKSDSAWAIDYFSPCNDCNPLFFLEDASTGTSAERTSEVDVYYIHKYYYKLDSNSCYVDTMDVAEWINYDLKKNRKYRFWIEYQPYLFKEDRDPIHNIPIWKDSLVSDTLVFIHK